MNKLKQLISKCNASVSITANPHRDYYQSVKDYIEELKLTNEDLINDIGLDVYEEMKKTDTIIEIYAYPDTPIGNYMIIHHDIEKAIDIILNCINNGW